MTVAEYKNLAVNGELLMNLPIVWACVSVFRRGETRRPLSLLSAGVLLGCAVLLKQPAGAAAIALGLYMLMPSYRSERGISM